MSARDRLHRHPTAAAALLYAVLALALFAPGMLPGRVLSASDVLYTSAPWASERPAGVKPAGANHNLRDSALHFQVFLEMTRKTLPDVPLWNPHIMGGRPYLANMQAAVFSPFSLPAYVLPFWQSLAFIAALKVFLAALGTFLLGRALGMSFAAALLAGTAFGFSLWMVTWVSWTLATVWLHLPWLCLVTERLLDHARATTFAALAALVTLQFFGGHPESSFHVLAFLVLFFVLRLARRRPHDRRGVVRSVLAFGGALVAGAALAAVALIPFLELFQLSVDREAREAFHEEPRFLLGLFLHDFWGRQTRVNLEFLGAMEERAYYVGAVTLILAAAALVLRPCVDRVVLFAVGAIALTLAVGLPPLSDVVTALPGFSTANNARLAVIAVFCLALLAGWGLDDLMASWPSRSRRRALLALAGTLAALPVVVMVVGGTLVPELWREAVRVAWLSRAPTELSGDSLAAVIRLASLLEWLVPAGAVLLLLVLRAARRIRAPAFAALLLLVLAADLLKAGIGFNPAIPTDAAVQPATPSIDYLRSQRPARFAGVSAPGSSAFLPPVAMNTSMRYGLYDARGYDFPLERRYLTLWRRYVADADCNFAFCSSETSTRPRSLRVLGMLGVSDLLQSPDEPRLPLRITYSGADARVYANPHAIPRAFVVDRQRVVPDEEAALALLGSPGFDPREVAVTEQRLPGLGELEELRARPAGAARILRYERERVEIATRSRGTTLLVLTDLHYPGWRATVDDREVDVKRVDYLLRGVRLPAGTHRVVFSYRPDSWRAAWIVSALALLTLAVAVLRRSARNVAMRATTGLLAALLALALMAPAAALGQSAGDEQYVDPFQQENSDQGGGGSNGNGSEGQAPEPAPPAEVPTDQGVVDPPPTAAPESLANGSETLPRTGLAVASLILSGLALLGGGAALRRVGRRSG